MHVVLTQEPAATVGSVAVPEIGVPDGGARPGEPRHLPAAHLADEVRSAPGPVRWTWDDTNKWYPELLTAGVRVDRSHDLRLAHAILRASALTAGTAFAAAPRGPWDGLVPTPPGPTSAGLGREPAAEALFELEGAAAVRRLGTLRPGRPGEGRPGEGRYGEGRQGEGEPGTEGERPTSDTRPGDREPGDRLDPLAELTAQLGAVAASADPGRLRLLLAAESAGALAAAEMHHTGLPWRADVHDAILTEALGPRPRLGARPERLEALVQRIRDALDAPPTLNPDSHPDLLKAMEYAGVGARSLRKWELERLDHPVVEPLLEYKSLYRLWTANGWTWLDTWAPHGRFRMEYIVGGVVTGRWASSGGGALQLPKNVRGAVLADPGWTFVVADAAQLEPRVLAGLARDERMAAAGRTHDGTPTDLYAGIVATGAVETREHAKVGMLGAMYGGTTGVSAQVMPKLAKAFPDAIELVERAARAGERGEVVSTRLGRSSPPPGESWASVQGSAFDEDAGADAQSRARSQTRAWGRFTRNFVVQGTAAEWALCWVASIRRRLWALGEADIEPGLTPEPFARRPHLVYFLHDEVVVHAPVALADAVADEVRAAAEEAGRLLFAGFPVDFPLSVAVVESYADAK
ncbi:bifunctional 3'-5' exonuclease/DNA polymerase [Antribacter gilvus]|uniref:bifunctional 3'-5' exonuclease/DNA polymerase n=1 Tax=Antribacter gilvus TaxID=2304675 RepID=UPI001F0C6773|nr:bifunctional 3'-5' exonuclease/DNA polymerase [Antribacter gilvus]